MRRRGADILVDSLVAAGVRTIFGVPGDTGVALYDALYHRTGGLQHVLARDERHAATMADAYSRVTNRIGVVEVSSGGGVSYVIGGLGEAYAAGIPVLVITSDIHSRSRGTGALTEIDQLAMFSGCTKWRCRVSSAAEVPAAVATAIREMTRGRPAPAAIVVPEDVLDEPVDDRIGPTLQIPPSQPHLPGERPNADLRDLIRATEMLVAARRPAILAGAGVHTSGAWSALARLASRAAIPVATTIHGKGAISDTHPFALGVAGNNGGRPYANEYLRSSDVALFVGTRANATDTNSFTTPPRDTAKIIHLDISGERAGWNYPSALRLIADARTALEGIDRMMPAADDSVRAERQRGIAEARCEWEAVESRPLPTSGAEIVPRDLVRALSRLVPADAVLVADPGTPTPNVASYWTVTEPGRSVVMPRGHGPMGYAIPAAIGIAFARPSSPVAALTGDGSFAMACGELETAARYRLPILFIQLTNHSLGWIKMLQHLYCGKRYFGVDPGPIDAAAVARACGLTAVRAQSLADFETAVLGFVTARQPTYIDVEVPHLIDLTPPVPAWLAAMEGLEGRPVY